MEKKPKYRVIYEELSDKIRNGTYGSLTVKFNKKRLQVA